MFRSERYRLRVRTENSRTGKRRLHCQRPIAVAAMQLLINDWGRVVTLAWPRRSRPAQCSTCRSSSKPAPPSNQQQLQLLWAIDDQAAKDNAIPRSTAKDHFIDYQCMHGVSGTRESRTVNQPVYLQTPNSTRRTFLHSTSMDTPPSQSTKASGWTRGVVTMHLLI